jgi:hypothetical protein
VNSIEHGCNTLNGWISSGGCFGAGFWETLRERGLMAVLGMAWMTFEALADHAA